MTWSFRRPQLACEQLESRTLLSGFSHRSRLDDSDKGESESDYHKTMLAGDTGGANPDQPSNRVDPNSTSSPFAGVGSLNIVTKRYSGICTATPISSTHVLTAAHCLDSNDDGRITKRDKLVAIYFNLNFGSDMSHQIQAVAWQLHPDFTGFGRPSVNDDLAVLTLSTSLPEGVPIYPIYTGPMDEVLHLVGYGRSGDGVSGYTIAASFTVKRYGENFPDKLQDQDDQYAAIVDEIFEYDFDGPTGNGPTGGPTLGNDRETTLGSGDSGGPAFVLVGADPTQASSYALAGVNTYTRDTWAVQSPRFGSFGGGVIVAPYLAWIQSVLNPPPS